MRRRWVQGDRRQSSEVGDDPPRLVERQVASQAGPAQHGCDLAEQSRRAHELDPPVQRGFEHQHRRCVGIARQGSGYQDVGVGEDTDHAARLRASARAAASSSRTSRRAASSSKSLRLRIRAASERRSAARSARAPSSAGVDCVSLAERVAGPSALPAADAPVRRARDGDVLGVDPLDLDTILGCLRPQLEASWSLA
jgi:hypothetical protein